MQTSCLALLLLAVSARAQQSPLGAPLPPVTPAQPLPTPLPTLPAPLPTSSAPPLPATTPLPAPQDEPLSVAARRLKLPLPLPGARIVVCKSARRLELWSGATLVKTYRVALGGDPRGAKQRRGDRRTPEGRFYICTRNDRTTGFHRFMGLSYPALPDARRGLQTRRLSAREYQVIRRRLASRGAPPWNTRLGGWVGIHGGSDGAFARRVGPQRGRDWTAGCVALSNRHSEELFSATRLGTPVEIKP